MRTKILFWVLGISFYLLGPIPLYGQEISDLKDIQINMHQEPWSFPDGSSAPRNFEAKALPGLLEELLNYNPEILALVEKIKSLENHIDPAGSLEDPRLSLEGSNIPISPPALNRTPMTGLQLYYRQKVPWPGKLKLKKAIARSLAEQEKQEYYEKLNQLVAKFKKTYFDYREATEVLIIYESTTSRLSGLGKILEARYSASEAPQQDILKNKVKISNFQETMVELKQRKKTLLARMNTLLNRPYGTPLKIKKVSEKRMRLKTPLPDLLKIAERYRPWLKKNELEIQEATQKHQLAKKDLLPDFDFGAGWRFRQASPGDPVMGEDFFSLGFSINLPVYAGKKQNKEIAAAVHELKMREYLKTATTQEIRYQVESIYYKLEQLNSQLGILASRSLPQARAAVDSSRVNYQADEVDFLNVLTNEIALLEQRIKQAVYHYEYEKMLADLEMATGLPIHLLNELNGKEVNHDERS